MISRKENTYLCANILVCQHIYCKTVLLVIILRVIGVPYYYKCKHQIYKCIEYEYFHNVFKYSLNNFMTGGVAMNNN